MQAGKLDKRVRIETVTEGRDASGGKTRTWVLLEEVWADVKNPSGRLGLLGPEIATQAEYAVEIRYREDVDDTARIVYKGASYAIVHIAEIGRREGLRLLIKSPGAD